MDGRMKLETTVSLLGQEKIPHGIEQMILMKSNLMSGK